MTPVSDCIVLIVFRHNIFCFNEEHINFGFIRMIFTKRIKRVHRARRITSCSLCKQSLGWSFIVLFSIAPLNLHAPTGLSLGHHSQVLSRYRTTWGLLPAGFPSGPVRPSLDDLDNSPSDRSSISAPCLTWMPDQHEHIYARNPGPTKSRTLASK